MARTMLAHLLDVSLRSTVVAMLAAAAVWALGRRRVAAAHRLWTGALCGMLALFAAGSLVPPVPLRVLAPVAASTVASGWPEVILIVWAAIAFGFGVRLAVGWWLTRRLMSAAKPVRDGVYESAAVAVPLTVGCWRPGVLLPAEWRGWESNKLETVLRHESAHIARRDALVALVAGVNRCVFWFHPLAWWLERKLELLAEQACDAACLRAVADRREYARLLVEMAGAMERAGGRVRWRALAMAHPSHLGRRIERILEAPIGQEPQISRAAWVALAACALPLVYAAAAIRLEPQAPLLSLTLPALTSPAPPAHWNSVGRVLPRIPNFTESDLYAAAVRESDPRRRIELVDVGQARYPQSKLKWLQLSLNTYSQLNDIPNLLAVLNQMGKEEFLRTVTIHPPQVSRALFYYARAVTYDGPGSLAAEGRQQLDDYLHKTYNSIYGQNEVGLDELKRLAKSYPLPPQYFQIAPLPPPSRTFDATLATERSSIRIHNQCPYGMRIDCNGPERKRAWIESGQDAQMMVAPGTYQIYVANSSGVSSFTGPGRFDAQFDYAYTLSLRRD